MWHRLMKKCEGTISLFLAIIMLATFVMSGVIVEGARLRQAEAIVQSAADSAAMSVLAKYDKELNDRFGLFALDESTIQNIQDDYMDFFMTNLSAKLPSTTNLDTLFRQLEAKYGLASGKIDANFDFFEFQKTRSDVQPIYSIANPEILKVQATEAAKYRSVVLLLQDLTGLGGDLSSSASQQSKDVQAMQSSLDVREESGNVSNKLVDFSNKLINFYDELSTDTNGNISPIDKANGLKLRNELTSLTNDLYSKYQALNDSIHTVNAQYASINTAINEYNGAVGELVSKETALLQRREELLTEKESLILDESDENYSKDAVDAWNTSWEKWKTEDCKEVDDYINDPVKVKTTGVNTAISSYITACNTANQANINYQAAVDAIVRWLDSVKSDLNALKNEWNGLKGSVQTAKNNTSNFKNGIDAGVSADVRNSLGSDADTITDALDEALNAGTEEKLNQTIEDIDKIIEHINNHKIDDVDITITTLDKSVADLVNDLLLSSNYSVTEIEKDFQEYIDGKTSDDDLGERAEWGSLSKMDAFRLDQTCKVEPNTFLSSAVGQADSDIAKAIYSIAMGSYSSPRGSLGIPHIDHYIYTCNLQYTDKNGNSVSPQSAKTNSLIDLYKNNNNDSQGGTLQDNNRKVINPSTLPSKNEASLNLEESFATADANHFSSVVRRYGENTTIGGQGTTMLADDRGTLEGLGSFNFGESKDSQNGAFNLMSGFMDKVSDFFTNAQYNVMTYTYVMGMFKSRMTNTSDYWREKQDLSNGKSSKRYAINRAEETDTDLMMRDKNGLSTQLNYQLEYVIYGNEKDKSNADAVWATIYGIRLGNNLIAAYCDDEIRTAAQSAASAIAAAASTVTFGLGSLLAPLIQFAIILAIAVLETYMDMTFLVDKGYKVPFIKTSDNLNINLDNLADFDVSEPEYGDHDIMIKYEDYLLIFMLFAGQKNVLLRTADLIQMDMQELTGDPNYDLKTKKTYLRCENEVSIKSLLIKLPFDDMISDSNNQSYDKIKLDNGNRLKVAPTLIYQGY